MYAYLSLGVFLLYTRTKEEDPAQGYEGLVDRIETHSPTPEARLRNLRTLGRLFEIRKKSSLAHWQAWRTKVYWWGKPFFQQIFLNRDNGHVFQVLESGQI